MTVQLVKGQNIPVPAADLELSLIADGIAVHAVLVGADGRVAAAADVLGRDRPAAPGVSLQGGRLSVRPDRVAPGVARIHLVATGSLTGITLHAQVLAGAERVATFDCGGLTVERAVQVMELYRRGDGWKVRAVGQGYAGGMQELLTVHGAPAGALAPAAAPAASVPAAPPPAPSAPPQVPADPYVITAAERQTRELRGIFQDAARSSAGYREAIAFAERRRDRDLEELVGDPTGRAADHPGRLAAAGRYDELVLRATADHQRDMNALRGELTALERSLIPALADWRSPAWRAPAPGEGWQEAIRIGEVTIPDAAGLRIPLVTGSLTQRAIWLGCQVVDEAAVRAALGLCLRSVAAAPRGAVRMRLVDPYRGLSNRLSGLPGVTADPVGADALGAVLRELSARMDLVGMARQAGATDSLPAEVANACVLLVLVGVCPDPGPDLQALRHLIEEGGRAGIGVLIVDDARKAAETELPLMVVPAEGTGTLVDGWVGLEWEYHPDPGPADPAWTTEALRRLTG